MAGVSRFDCFPSDFLNGVIGMTADQIAVYTVVLMLQYDRGEHVIYIGREREIAIRSGLSRKRLEKAVAELIVLGKLQTDGETVFNRRADGEIEKIREKIEKNRENSEKGGIATREKYYKKPLENNVRAEPTGQQTGQPSLGPILRPPSPVPRPPSKIKESPLPSEGPQGGRPRSRSAGCTLPEEWTPPEELFDYGMDAGLSRAETADVLENMKLWARANRNRPIGRKADWTSAMKGAIRRDAAKSRARAGPPKRGGVSDLWRELSEIGDERRQGEIDSGNDARISFNPSDPA